MEPYYSYPILPPLYEKFANFSEEVPLEASEPEHLVAPLDDLQEGLNLTKPIQTPINPSFIQQTLYDSPSPYTPFPNFSAVYPCYVPPALASIQPMRSSLLHEETSIEQSRDSDKLPFVSCTVYRTATNPPQFFVPLKVTGVKIGEMTLSLPQSVNLEVLLPNLAWGELLSPSYKKTDKPIQPLVNKKSIEDHSPQSDQASLNKSSPCTTSEKEDYKVQEVTKQCLKSSNNETLPPKKIIRNASPKNSNRKRQWKFREWTFQRNLNQNSQKKFLNSMKRTV